ncbi:hypothetical protein T492DRAFT_843944 [Pavlovales sp. CCMP2436]|nr:hypothetical protein T492DRAFT_843944 [Pavlovales sp. CCMP2436]
MRMIITPTNTSPPRPHTQVDVSSFAVTTVPDCTPDSDAPAAGEGGGGVGPLAAAAYLPEHRIFVGVRPFARALALHLVAPNSNDNGNSEEANNPLDWSYAEGDSGADEERPTRDNANENSEFAKGDEKVDALAEAKAAYGMGPSSERKMSSRSLRRTLLLEWGRQTNSTPKKR